MVWQSIQSSEWNATFHSVSEQVEKQQAWALAFVFLLCFGKGRGEGGRQRGFALVEGEFGGGGHACSCPVSPPKICCSQEVGGVRSGALSTKGHSAVFFTF